jgi:3-phosphoshikimate 1-carboxyvinyltransferase
MTDCEIISGEQSIIKTIPDIPGDKSISHRAVLLGSIAEGQYSFNNFLFSEDCLNSVKIFQALGVDIKTDASAKSINIKGVGLNGLKPYNGLLDAGNSGTLIRLVCGILATQPFPSRISGDKSIRNRPMKRIIAPLAEMGCRIAGKTKAGKTDIYPPLTIVPAENLKGITYHLTVASAQVKSAILLTALKAVGQTTVIEPALCRDHTERMLKLFNVPLKINDKTITIEGQAQLKTALTEILIPADFSSAAFFIVLGLILPGSRLKLTNVGLNPTRISLINVLKNMGAKISLKNVKADYFEPYGDIEVEYSALSNVAVPKADIPILIDEVPILAIASLFAKGQFSIRDAKELRVKESDRIAAIIKLVKALDPGVAVTEYPDGFDLLPSGQFQDFEIYSFADHRIAMSGIIGAIAAKRNARIKSIDCIKTSFPNFFDILGNLDINYKLV